MLDMVLAREAFRARVLNLVVASTGSQTLSATTAGFARASGSFITDGFAAGMEITASGFNAGNNASHMIQTVTTGLLTLVGGATVQSATAGRTITAGIPEIRQWENTQTPVTSAVATRPFIRDEWIPATFNLISVPIQGGHVEESGLYVITWFGLANNGILALRRSIEALKAKFTPGTKVSVGGLFLRVPASPGPVAGQIIPTENGYATVQLTIPWRCASVNAVAA